MTLTKSEINARVGYWGLQLDHVKRRINIGGYAMVEFKADVERISEGLHVLYGHIEEEIYGSDRTKASGDRGGAGSEDSEHHLVVPSVAGNGVPGQSDAGR